VDQTVREGTRTKESKKMIICIGPFCIPVVWGLPFLAALAVSLKNWLNNIVWGRGPHDQVSFTLPGSNGKEGVIALTEESALNDLTTKKDGALLYFTASWCTPCRTISPAVADLSARFPSVAFIKIDADQFQDLAEQYNIGALPTFILLLNSKEQARLQGARERELQNILCSHFSGE
jgi:thioredoxin 1